MNKVKESIRIQYYLIYHPIVDIEGGQKTGGPVAIKLASHKMAYIAFDNLKVCEEFQQRQHCGGFVISASQLGSDRFPLLLKEDTILLTILDQETLISLEKGKFDKLSEKIVEFRI